jgi:hypothetical protein
LSSGRADSPWAPFPVRRCTSSVRGCGECGRNSSMQVQVILPLWTAWHTCCRRSASLHTTNACGATQETTPTEYQHHLSVPTVSEWGSPEALPPMPSARTAAAIPCQKYIPSAHIPRRLESVCHTTARFRLVGALLLLRCDNRTCKDSQQKDL